jgi:hypothetical protein
MKPFKSGSSVSAWLIRILAVWVAYINHFSAFKTFDFSTREFWIASAYMVFSALIFTGGFLSRHTMSVVSGFLLLSTPVVHIMISGIPGGVLCLYCRILFR